MRMVDLQSQDFVCEVCGESAANARMVGVESDSDITSRRFDFVIVADPSIST